MNNFYEIGFIAFGVWNLTLQLRLNSKRRQAQKLMYSLDKIVQKKWKVVETRSGFDVVDHEGDNVMSVTNRGKR
jgi:hypothetical protein